MPMQKPKLMSNFTTLQLVFNRLDKLTSRCLDLWMTVALVGTADSALRMLNSFLGRFCFWRAFHSSRDISMATSTTSSPSGGLEHISGYMRVNRLKPQGKLRLYSGCSYKLLDSPILCINLDRLRSILSMPHILNGRFINCCTRSDK